MEELDNVIDDRIVISGIAGMFPECDNIEELKQSLFKKENLVKVVSDLSWKRDKLQVSNKVGKVKEVATFDSLFFGITVAQTQYMDPMTRKMLEKTYEAIIDSGHSPTDLRKHKVNVYTGSNVSPSEATFLYSGATESGFSVLGHNRSMLANRLSYWLGSTGSSSSFYATEPAGLHGISLAYNDIKAGYCDAAIIGTVFLCMHPEQLYCYKEIGVLSKDETTRAFDAAADGYARGEACVAIIMERECNARRAYASVVHSDFICYGLQESLIFPQQEAFTEFLDNFYKTCNVDPNEIEFLEADGSSSKYHDIRELNAVDQVLLSKRNSPLLIGTVKTNTGHADTCSSLVSLAKVIIAIQEGSIPPNLHYEHPSPLIPALVEGRLKVVTETTKWDRGLVAMNSIGMGGEYTHTLLRPYIKNKKNQNFSEDDLPRLICVSARNEEGMKHVMEKISSIPYDAELVSLLHDVHSTNIANHNFRGYTIIKPSSNEKIAESFEYFSAAKQPIWFVFSGMGSQWIGMGRDLMKHPLLAATLQKCHEILVPKGIDLLHIITGDDPHMFDNILHSFVGIAAIQLALVDFLKALDIEPEGIVGHSVGELGCAYADGCFTLEQMILAAYYRGLASIESELIHGSMAAIGKGYSQMKDEIPDGIDIACHNSGDSCTLSGPTDTVIAYVEVLKKEGIFAKAVNVSNIAYHSRYIKPAAPKLLSYLKKIIPDPKPRSSKWISSSVPENLWDTDLAKYCSAEYHTNNLLSSVLFEEASSYIPINAITIEIAPHGLLQAILRRSLGKDCINIPLTSRDAGNGLHFLLNAIGKLYIAGGEPHLRNIYPTIEYPVSCQTPSLSFLFTWDHEKIWHIPSEVKMYENPLGDFKLKIDLRSGEDQILRGQRTKGLIIYPPSAILVSLWQIFITAQRQDPLKHAVVIQNVKFYNVVKLAENSSLVLHISIALGCKRFEIFNDDKQLLVTGLISEIEEGKNLFQKNVTVNVDNGYEFTEKEIYKELEYKGHHYNNVFKCIHHVKIGKQGAVAKIHWYEDWLIFLDSIIQLAMWKTTRDLPGTQTPTYIQQVILDPLQHETVYKEFSATYHNVTKTIRCGGVEISGLELGDISLSDKYILSMETTRFFSHDSPCLQNKEEFLEVAVQLLLENIPAESKQKVLTFVELTNNLTLKPLLHEVKYILSHKEGVKADLRSVSIENIKSLSEERNISFVLANEGLIEESAEFINNSSGFLLLRLPIEQSVPLKLGLVTVVEQQFDNEIYILLKKKTQVKKQDVVFLHLKNDCSTWIEQVKQTINNTKLEKKSYLVCEEKSYERVQYFVSEVLPQLDKTNNIRYIFLLDNNIAWTSHPDQKVLKCLSQDLLVNVHYDGTWGSFRQLSLPPIKSSPLKNLLSDMRVNSFDVRFVGLNSNDWCVNEEDSFQVKTDFDNIGVLELTGWSTSGKRKMGLASINKRKNTVNLDSESVWTVPDSWSLQDAATVLYPYYLAYYVLTVRTTIENPGMTLLVHGGHTFIGEAFIAVALQFKCIVYTTVYNDEDRKYIEKRFPQMHRNNILKINKHFSFKLFEQVKSDGVDIIISSLSGSYLYSSLKCVRLLSDMFHFCREDVNQNTELGMEIFLKCCKFSSVLPEHIFGVTQSEKKKLHEMLETALVSGIVQPFKRKILTLQEEDQVLSSMNHVRKTVIDLCKSPRSVSKTNHLEPIRRFSKENSCLIVGEKPEDCLDIAKWLVERGVYKITMYSEISHTSSDYVKYQMKMLHSLYSLYVRFSSVDNSESPHAKAAGVIKECTNTAPLESVFLVSPADDSFVTNLHLATQDINSLKNFVCLQVESSRDVIRSRRDMGLPALDIKWSGQQIMNHVFTAIDSLLVDPPLSTVHILLKDAENKETTTTSDSEQMDTILPSTLKELEELGRDLALQKDVPIIQLSSNGPSINHVKEVPPIFMILGLNGASMRTCKELARNLFYPVILLRVPPHKTLSEMARNLVKHIRTVQPDGPYNIVGLSWGGALALQVAQELQDDSQTAQVFLIDAQPKIAQRVLNKLLQHRDLQHYLITYLLELSSDKGIIGSPDLHTWEEKLLGSVSQLDLTEQAKTRIVTAMNTIYDAVKAIINFRINKLYFNGEVYIIESEEFEEEYSGITDEMPNYKVKNQTVKCSHKMLFSEKAVIQTICEHALVNLHAGKLHL